MGLLKALSKYIKELLKPAQIVALAIYGTVFYVIWNVIGKTRGIIGVIITFVTVGLVSVSLKSVFKLGKR